MNWNEEGEVVNKNHIDQIRAMCEFVASFISKPVAVVVTRVEAEVAVGYRVVVGAATALDGVLFHQAFLDYLSLMIVHEEI